MSYKQIKKLAAMAFAIVAMVAYVMDTNVSKAPLMVSIDEKDTVEIVLLDAQLDCVPLSISISENATMEEKLNKIVDSMSVNQNVTSLFKGIFAANTKINSFHIDELTLVIDFNSNFADYDPAIELKLLEAMSYVFTQFDGIEALQFKIDSVDVSRMPKTQMSVFQPVNRAIGFNNFDSLNSVFHNSDTIFVAIEKHTKEFNYFTLKSLRSTRPLEESLETYFTRKDSIFIDNNVKYKKFDLELVDDNLNVNMSREILTPQNTCDTELLNQILFTLKSNYEVKTITIYVDDVLMGSYVINQLHFNKL